MRGLYLFSTFFRHILDGIVMILTTGSGSMKEGRLHGKEVKWWLEEDLSCGRVNLELVSVVAQLELDVLIMLLVTVDVKIVWSWLVKQTLCCQLVEQLQTLSTLRDVTTILELKVQMFKRKNNLIYIGTLT